MQKKLRKTELRGESGIHYSIIQKSDSQGGCINV